MPFQRSRYFESDVRTITNKVNCIWYIREDYRDGRRAGRGVLVRGGRPAQVIAQESVEEHIRGSVERLDNQFSTLHQDVATLSCEVLSTQIISYNVIYIILILRKRITTNAKLFYIYSKAIDLLYLFRESLTFE